MVSCPKCRQPAAAAVPAARPLRPDDLQPAVQRHAHPIPLKNSPDLSLSDGQSALLRAVERQNVLLTDLLGAVNGLTALLCSQRSDRAT